LRYFPRSRPSCILEPRFGSRNQQPRAKLREINPWQLNRYSGQAGDGWRDPQSRAFRYADRSERMIQFSSNIFLIVKNPTPPAPRLYDAESTAGARLDF
jgi:hypothetical protein